MPQLEIVQIPVLSDNYAVLVHDPDSGKTASIDAPEAGPILEELKARGWTLSDIFVTHKHMDHIGGVGLLKREFDCTVTGPEASAAVTGIYDVTVKEGDSLDFAGHPIQVFETPGHTMDHISYYWPEDKLAFVGDTMFALGCGRVFEGTPQMMWDSLKKIRDLPGDTTVYCGHEYTKSNADYAVTVEPDNDALLARRIHIDELRLSDEPTLPTTIEVETRTNPFLRADVDSVKEAMDMAGANEVAVFAEIRRGKDNF